MKNCGWKRAKNPLVKAGFSSARDVSFEIAILGLEFGDFTPEELIDRFLMRSVRKAEKGLRNRTVMSNAQLETFFAVFALMRRHNASVKD